MFATLKRLLGCDRRACENELRVFAWRVRHATTLATLETIADDAIKAGLITEVSEMLDEKERETQ